MQDGGQTPDEPLARRDYVLIPLTIILTLVVLAVVFEAGARMLWTEQAIDSCEVWDKETLVRVTPNCHARVKSAEGGWVDYLYNECGFRSAASCKSKPAHARRIVVMGTSVSRGYWIPYDESFSGRLETQLSSECRQPVEFQNLSIGVAKGPIWHTIADHGSQALALEPDAIILVVTNFDLSQYHTQVSGHEGALPQKKGWFEKIEQLKTQVNSESRGISMAKHFALADPDRYVRFFLRHGDSADFLRSPLTSEWQYRLEVVDKAVGAVAGMARAKGVPVYLLLAPSRPAVLAAHIDAANPIPGVDLHVFPDALAAIAARHGVQFVDPTSAESRATTWNDLYFFADGHPTALGHGFIADALHDALVDSAPRFSSCGRGNSKFSSTQRERSVR